MLLYFIKVFHYFKTSINLSPAALVFRTNQSIETMNHLRPTAMVTATAATAATAHSLSLSQGIRYLSYYVPIAVRRRQKLEALKSLREALHAETVLRSSSSEQQESSMYRNHKSMSSSNITEQQQGDHDASFPSSSSITHSSSASAATSLDALSNPTLEMARNLPTSFRHLDNTTIMVLASMDHPPLHKARAEYLRRHVMNVDQIDYLQACKRVSEIEQTGRERMTLTALPYKMGLFTALTASVVTTPLLFHYDTVAWFNERFVTADIPEPADIETWLEVGGWAWNWYVCVSILCTHYLLPLHFLSNFFKIDCFTLSSSSTSGWYVGHS